MNAEPIIEAIENIEQSERAAKEHDALERGLIAVLTLPKVHGNDRRLYRRPVYILADGWHLVDSVVIDELHRYVVTDCGRVVQFAAIEDFRMFPGDYCMGCG